MGFPDDVLTKIDFQWSKLTTVEWKNIQNAGEFWNEVSNYKDASGFNPFKEISELAIILLVLPWSNADVERAFSQLNFIKMPLRNRLPLYNGEFYNYYKIQTLSLIHI